jgi:hypothetical protein
VGSGWQPTDPAVALDRTPGLSLSPPSSHLTLDRAQASARPLNTVEDDDAGEDDDDEMEDYLQIQRRRS